MLHYAAIVYEEFISWEVWLITGTSCGLSFAWAKSALDRGDLVIGVARNINN